MITTKKTDRETTDAREKIAVAAGVALLVAVAILLTVVLPAEYDLDPFGTGNALGLTALAQAQSGDGPLTQIVATDANQSAILSPQSRVYKVDSIELKLGPREGFEYKYHIEKGGGMVYSWKATGKVTYEFHGEPDGAARDVFQSYEKQDGDRASGAFSAPFTGIHGWYWENPGREPLTITLTSAGFYSTARESRAKKRSEHELADVRIGVKD